MKLLIVDDQSTVVQGLLHCTNWAAMGFTVVDTALNAVDAKASLLRQEAEVMLCDIEMPMESGLDLLDWLRQRGMTTRCIFLTAHAEFRYAQEALRLGGFDYIMQPAPYEQVADAVSRALENVKEERAALELQSRGAVFDDQKKEIVETMLRGFLLGNAPAPLPYSAASARFRAHSSAAFCSASSRFSPRRTFPRSCRTRSCSQCSSWCCWSSRTACSASM